MHDRSSMFEVLGSKLRKPGTSSLEPFTVARPVECNRHTYE